MVKEKLKIDQDLIFKFDGERLEDDDTLKDCGIEDEDMLEAKYA
jgi:hypothetical protein